MTKRKSGKDFILPQPKRIRLEAGSRKNSVTILQKHENPEESRVLTIYSKTKDSINVKKIPNSADKFNEKHQERYKAREKQSRDRIREVHEHNSTYPNLRSELEKRRSISRPAALSINKSKRNQNTAYNQRLNKKHGNGLSQRLLKKPINSRRRCEPVKKRRKQSGGTSCEVCAFLKDIGKMYDIYALTAEMEMASGAKRRELYEKLSKISQVTVESKCLASSNHSVSSYHSFGSMGEQPMV